MHEPLFTFPLVIQDTEIFSQNAICFLRNMLGRVGSVPWPCATEACLGRSLYINVLTRYFQNLMVIFLNMPSTELN